MATKFFDNTIVLRFGKTRVANVEFFGAKKPKQTWDVNHDNIVITKLIEAKTNSKYLIGYLDVMRPVVFILPKVNGYVKTFEDKNNELMSLHIDDDSYKKSIKPLGLRQSSP